MKFIGVLALGLVLGACTTESPVTTPNLRTEATENRAKPPKAETADQDAIFTANSDGETPLHLAAASENVEEVKRLLKAGANPNAKTKSGSTPLGYSIASGHGTVAELLLDHGANPSYAANGEWTPIHWAIGGQNAELVKKLLEKGVDPNTTDSGRSVLYTAAQVGTMKIVELLLEHGANPNLKTKESGDPPLFVAALNGPGLLETLAKYKADLNARNNIGQNVMDYIGELGRKFYASPQRVEIDPRTKRKLKSLTFTETYPHVFESVDWLQRRGVRITRR